jgi:N-acetylneuraminate synthase
MTTHLLINNRSVGPGHPVYIVAELSANHNQSFDLAVELVRAASAAGADAVKLQTYTADTLTIQSDQEFFRIGGGTLWDGRTLYDLYQEAYTPWEWQPKLKEIANGLGLDLFSSPFDFSSIDFLEQMGVPAYKVASFELTDIPLIERIAQTGKPVIISTGMATLSEIADAVQAASDAGASQLALLKCNSAYPAPVDEMNLRTIPHLSEAFNIPVGISDHTLGISVPISAVTLGACIIEKHFTLSRAAGGPDSAFSLEPDEFRMMVDAVRVTERALGEVSYSLTKGEASSRVLRRSLFVVEDVRQGEMFTEENVRSIRPGHGLSPKYIGQITGRHAVRNIRKGTPFSWDLIG